MTLSKNIDFVSFDHREAEKALAFVCDRSRHGYGCWILDCGSDDIHIGFSLDGLFSDRVLEEFADHIGLPVEAVCLGGYGSVRKELNVDGDVVPVRHVCGVASCWCAKSDVVADPSNRCQAIGCVRQSIVDGRFCGRHDSLALSRHLG